MPTFILNWIISLAIKFGMAWLLKKFPWLPDYVVKAIEDLLEELKSAKNCKKVAKKKAIAKIKSRGGIGTPPDLVS